MVSYRTVADPLIAERLRTFREEVMADEGPCWVVFFIPSGVQFALEHLNAVFSVDHLKVDIFLKLYILNEGLRSIVGQPKNQVLEIA